MLNELKEKLEEIDKNVFYGVAKEVDDDGHPIWNYIVFGRVKMTPSEHKTSFTDQYEVVIVRENYIPENLIDEVINKVEECKKLKLSKEPATYKYAYKSNTDEALEILQLKFIRARARCC